MTDLSSQDILLQLQKNSKDQGLESLSEQLQNLHHFVKEDLEMVHKELTSILKGPHLVEQGARHLLQLGGKRLRSLCVLLASQVGQSDSKQACELAVVVELVHNATLLHDDVVDVALERRGAKSVRMLYGNAISIFAGDLLLTEAIRRVRQTLYPQLLEPLLDVIETMIFSESLQLENRGTFRSDRNLYFQVIQGKTASLFQWALHAGGTAGKLAEEVCQSLSLYGFHLGIAFQIMDDVLDFSADQTVLGKRLFTDVQEGKMTLPLIIASEKDETFMLWLSEQITNGNIYQKECIQQIMDKLEKSNALIESRSIATEEVKKALLALEKIPDNQATLALASIAQTMLHRQF